MAGIKDYNSYNYNDWLESNTSLFVGSKADAQLYNTINIDADTGESVTGKVSLGLSTINTSKLSDAEAKELIKKFSATQIGSGDINGLINLVNGHLQSSNFMTGVTGWRIDSNGNLEANSGTFRGKLTAGSIHIPDEDTTANSFHVESDGDAFWGCIQSDFTSNNDNATAYILRTGVAKFQNATILGTFKTNISETSDRIYITGNTLRSYSANKADGAWELEITQNKLIFYNFATTNKKTAELFSGIADTCYLRIYDSSEVVSETYQFGATSFYPSNTGTSPSLGTSEKSWTASYIDTLNSDKISLIQTSSTGKSLNISRNLPSNLTDSPLVQILNDDSSDNQKCLYLINDGSGSAFGIYNRDANYLANPRAIDILNYSNSNSIYIDHLADDDLSDVYAVSIICNNAGTKLPGGIDMSQFSAGEPLFAAPADNTDPTGGGGAATGRIAIKIGGNIKYIAYY